MNDPIVMGGIAIIILALGGAVGLAGLGIFLAGRGLEAMRGDQDRRR